MTEEDVERRNCLAKSYPYCVRNILLEDQNHSIVSKMRLLTNTTFDHNTYIHIRYYIINIVIDEIWKNTKNTI